MDDAAEQEDNRVKMGGGATNFKPWLYKTQFKPGVSGNPSGRPKGPSMKVWAQNKLAAMTEEEREDFIDGLPKDILWRMSEGQPHQSTDMDVKGNVIVQFHESFNKDAKPTQEAAGSD